jgi:predicted glycogen debranching enzyme
MVFMTHQQNTVWIAYRLLRGPGPLRLKLMPSLHDRSHDEPVNTPLSGICLLTEREGQYEFSMHEEMPRLRMKAWGQQSAFTVERRTVTEVLYSIEESRGYEFRGELWSPGYFRLDVTEGETTALVASTESWETINAMNCDEALAAERERRRRRVAAAPEKAQQGLPGELVLAADQFIIQPVGRSEHAARVHAEGDEIRTVIAGYHWFTDWGRDTMISLEGLTLCTGRQAEAGYILRTFAFFLRDGLLPNLFPEGEREGLYHTADATLWFFHAIHRYLQVTNDQPTLCLLLPRLLEIIDHHLRGTRFGIGVDPQDGLLRQGQEGYQLTWMDAKVGDWVVTPRRGKAVEINALWYNALRLTTQWLEQENVETHRIGELTQQSEQVRESFNRRFWYEAGNHLYDVVDGEQGDDPTCRPNQVFAISLDHAVLQRERWEAVLNTVLEKLVTPFGLRTLAPGHPDYQSRYFGDLRARDAAYHQGTVWPWLMGAFVDAWIKAHPDRRGDARKFIEGFDSQLSQACVGSISEIFDAEPPFEARGCVAQAWSVAEVLRAWMKVHSCSCKNGS